MASLAELQSRRTALYVRLRAQSEQVAALNTQLVSLRRDILSLDYGSPLMTTMQMQERSLAENLATITTLVRRTEGDITLIEQQLGRLQDQ